MKETIRTLSRREWLALLSAGPACAQGMVTRGVKAAPRKKPSGIPFNARFTDVAAQAGLNAPIVYGGAAAKTTLWK